VPNTPKLALAQLMALELSPPEMVRLAAQTGCQAAGIRMIPVVPGGVAYPLMDDLAMLRETQRAVADTGVTIGDLEIAMLKPDTDVAWFLPFLEAGAKLGAKHVLVAGYDPDEGRLTATFAAFCDAAVPFGLTADLEFMPWSEVPDLASTIRIVSAAARPNGGVLLDALHFDRSGSRIEDIARVPRASLNYWQLCDGPREKPTTIEGLLHAARAERMFPGEGGIDLMSLVRAMPADLPISIEVPTAELARTVGPLERARRAVARTHELLARVAVELVP
jgi:sugar phosphate isomerase/epimerase